MGIFLERLALELREWRYLESNRRLIDEKELERARSAKQRSITHPYAKLIYDRAHDAIVGSSRDIPWMMACELFYMATVLDFLLIDEPHAASDEPWEAPFDVGAASEAIGNLTSWEVRTGLRELIRWGIVRDIMYCHIDREALGNLPQNIDSLIKKRCLGEL